MDQAISHLINQQWTKPALDWFMASISNIEIWKPFLALVILIALIFGRFRARASRERAASSRWTSMKAN